MPDFATNLRDELTEEEKSKRVAMIGDAVLFELTEFSDHFGEAQDAYNYLAGEQQLPAKKEWFKSQDRPVRAYNMLFPRMNQVMGDFLLQNQKRKVFPLPGGDPKIAELLQKLLDQFYSEKEVKFELIMTALAGICKFGYAYPHISNDFNLEGELTLKNKNEFEVLFDSRAMHPFLDDAAYMIQLRRADPVDLKNLWPEHKRELEERLSLRNKSDDFNSWVEMLTPRQRNLVFSSDMYEYSEGKYTIVEYHRFVWKQHKVFTDLDTGASEIWPEDIAENKKNIFLQIHPNHKFTDRIAHVKEITTVVPALNFMLEHYEPVLQDKTYDIVKFSFYPYGKKTIKNFGIFKNAKEPQDAFNEFENLKQNVLLQVANSGWKYRADRLENPEDVELYGTKPGINFNVKEGSLDDAIRRNEPIGNPTAISKLAQDQGDLIDKVMGMAGNFVFGQTQTKNENASLFALRTQQTQQAFQIGYTQWAQFNQRVDNKSIKLMQLFYTSERVVVITTPFNAEPEMVQLNTQVGGFIINDLSRGKYESIVDDQNSTPTMRLVRFRLKTELLTFLQGIFGPAMAQIVPWEWYLRDSVDLGDVEPLIKNLEGIGQAQAEEGEQQSAFNDIRQLLEGALGSMEVREKAASLSNNGTTKASNGNGRVNQPV